MRKLTLEIISILGYFCSQNKVQKWSLWEKNFDWGNGQAFLLNPWLSHILLKDGKDWSKQNYLKTDGKI